MSSRSTFQTTPGFCGDCGSILPLAQQTGNIVCYTCKKEYLVDVFSNRKVESIITFNSVDALKRQHESEKQRKNLSNTVEEKEGPVVVRKCPKCGNNHMSYAALQLRSADEGQTVFYTCTKCKFKENENS